LGQEKFHALWCHEFNKGVFEKKVIALPSQLVRLVQGGGVSVGEKVWGKRNCYVKILTIGF